ncbi:MAG: LptF/LptG family permease [Kiritimatiellae bacterium]|nr:LptF/LptG family permease [Kiritimatiellia bacterium]
MDILGKYTTVDYLITFVMTLLIFTFVMCVGAVIKAIDLLARGVSGGIILQAFLLNIPYIMTFSIPMSALTTVLLNFNRLCLDGELTAMKACGLSMWQIIAPPVMLSILLSGVCVYLNSWAAPNSHFARRQLLTEIGAEEPVNLLEEGRFVKDFPGIMIYVGKKDRTRVKDVVVYELGGAGVVRNVRAKTGTVTSDQERRMVVIDLYDVRIDQPDKHYPMDLSRSRHISAQHYPVRVSFDELWGKEGIRKKMSDMTMGELTHAIRHVNEAFPDLKYEELLKQRMSMVVEANERLALSLSCFAFTLLGIPLGMKSRRRESSVGVGISLLVVFFFYFFIILADALVGHPEWHPDLIVWIPVVLSELAGFAMIRRAN